MKSRGIRRRIGKIEAIFGAVRQAGDPSVALAMAQAFTPPELRALLGKLIDVPGTVLADVFTDVEMAEFRAKLAA